MKIAVCISGHLGQKNGRANLIDVAKSLQKYFTGFACEVDFFLYLSFDENTNSDIIEFYEYFFPATKKIIFKDSEFELSNFIFKNKRKETNIERTFKMFDKIEKCNELKKTHENSLNFKFDVVFRVRPDMIFLNEKKSKIQNILSADITSQKIYLPKFPWLISKFTVVDFFAFGNSYNMDIYSIAIQKIEHYYQKGLLFHPETILGYHLKKNNINVNYIEPVCFFSENSLEMEGFDALKIKKNSPYRIVEFIKYLINSYKPTLYI